MKGLKFFYSDGFRNYFVDRDLKFYFSPAKKEDGSNNSKYQWLGNMGIAGPIASYGLKPLFSSVNSTGNFIFILLSACVTFAISIIINIMIGSQVPVTAPEKVTFNNKDLQYMCKNAFKNNAFYFLFLALVVFAIVEGTFYTISGDQESFVAFVLTLLICGILYPTLHLRLQKRQVAKKVRRKYLQ
ncbi:MAG: hypothetical protein LBI43_00550 [Streptococcaceae bacterium]|jgi:hypothetical protein|nr:hypothetical protein [Streptococcaceae bacterium]